MASIVDLTMSIGPNTQVFPGYPVPVVHKWTTIREDGYFSNMLFLVEHTGTHMDSPAHFIEDAPTIDRLPPEKFVARAVALGFRSKKPGERLSERELDRALSEVGVEVGRGYYVLVSFGWDSKRGDEWLRYPYISDEAAAMLRDLGVEGVGVDSPSPDYAPFNVHKTLLPEAIVIIENLSGLERVVGRAFDFIVAPIKIEGGSAAPVRALAVFK